MADKSVSNDQFRSQHASEELGDIIEISGHIKWFDVAKGSSRADAAAAHPCHRHAVERT